MNDSVSQPGEIHYARRPGTDVTVTVSKVEIMLHLLLVR